MKTKWPPKPETALGDLAPLSTVLYPAMDAAVDHAVQFFERHGFDEIDPWLHSHLVRHYTKPRLKADKVEELGY